MSDLVGWNNQPCSHIHYPYTICSTGFQYCVWYSLVLGIRNTYDSLLRRLRNRKRRRGGDATRQDARLDATRQDARRDGTRQDARRDARREDARRDATRRDKTQGETRRDKRQDRRRNAERDVEYNNICGPTVVYENNNIFIIFLGKRQ
jgi:hypothetical protein